MQSAEIARRFLAYFEAQGHTIVPSANLVADDPTLLFVVAGMQPFKPYLLGQQTPPFKRAADVQKCVRTLDIEEVGKTTRHGTFFQMLGNWSFGDYFKEGAIRFAWELITKSQADGGFGFPEDRLWPTVLHGDDETYAIWRDEIGAPRGVGANLNRVTPGGQRLGGRLTGEVVTGRPLNVVVTRFRP